MAEGRRRPAWVEIDLDAVRSNVSLLRSVVSPAALCAVVKADGYGHGAVPVARAALEAGAERLAVALVDEGIELREHGVTAPVLVLSEALGEAAEAAARAGLTLTVGSSEGLADAVAAARRVGARVPVHVKVDTGMHRLGMPPESASAVVGAVVGEPALHLEAVWTHLAVAEGTSGEDRAFTALQLERFDEVVAGLAVQPTLRHAANTAGAIAWPPARYDMVRCGGGIYGLAPSSASGSTSGAVGADAADDGVGADAADDGVGADAADVLARLRPALSLKALVTAVRELDAGERPSYGRLRPLPERSIVATVPLGYADGVPRALFTAGGEVLVRGARRPLAGMVSMDQLVVDCGPDAPVRTGEEVVLLGTQGSGAITVADWAAMVGTIGYEIVCSLSQRVRREHHGETGSRSDAGVSPRRGAAAAR